MKTASMRAPAVAGVFYPSSAKQLKADVADYLSEGRGIRPLAPVKALIAPHAGYAYSGPVAGSAFACLETQHKSITRVVILGPSHRVSFRGMALSSADAFETPLGAVELDHTVTPQLKALGTVHTNDRAHRDEHALEVELPFLQQALHHFSIVPVVVGDTTASDVAAVMEQLWGGPETLIVVSSDLSHYLPYHQAQAMDAMTARAIVELDPEHIEPSMACGRLPIQGLLIAAKKHGLKATLLDQRNSGDTSGDKYQVVGYGAYVFNA